MKPDLTGITKVFSPGRLLQIRVDTKIQGRLVKMCDHCHSSSFSIIELATNMAVVVFVAVVVSEGLVIGVLIGIVMLAFIFPSGQEGYSHLDFCRQVTGKTDVFSREQFRPYSYRDGWRSSGYIREVWGQLG